MGEDLVRGGETCGWPRAPFRRRNRACSPGNSRRKEEPMVADTPGGQWLAIISRPTLEGFSAACTPDAALNLSAAEGPVVGPAAVRHFFNITQTRRTAGRCGFGAGGAGLPGVPVPAWPPLTPRGGRARRTTSTTVVPST